MHLDVLPTGLTGFVILMRDDLFHQVSKANIDNILGSLYDMVDLQAQSQWDLHPLDGQHQPA